MLDSVERRTFGGQHRTRKSGEAHQVAARACARAFVGENLDSDIAVERAKKRLCNRQARDDDVLAAVHNPRKAGIGGNRRARGDIAIVA